MCNFREVVGKYTVEIRKLASEMLEIISQGLGLSPDYFSGELSANPTMIVNHYQRCPEPSLALGLAKHRDPSIITVIHQQDVPGLQVLLDGNWVLVQPIPHALIVNIGYILQVNKINVSFGTNSLLILWYYFGFNFQHFRLQCINYVAL